MCHPIWQPFGRLSFCAYIVHRMVLFWFYNLETHVPVVSSAMQMVRVFLCFSRPTIIFSSYTIRSLQQFSLLLLLSFGVHFLRFLLSGTVLKKHLFERSNMPESRKFSWSLIFSVDGIRVRRQKKCEFEGEQSSEFAAENNEFTVWIL